MSNAAWEIMKEGLDAKKKNKEERSLSEIPGCISDISILSHQGKDCHHQTEFKLDGKEGGQTQSRQIGCWAEHRQVNMKSGKTEVEQICDDFKLSMALKALLTTSKINTDCPKKH
jgi:hypothetical protein